MPACREQLGYDRLTVMRVYEGDFIHTIENFLDPVHTAILHRGIIRSAGMQHMRYKQTHDETGFVGHFTMMNQQNGLVNRLFDPGVTINIATFTVPSHATIEFLVDKDKVYEISWFFIPIDKGVVGMSTNIYIPKSKIPAWVKFALMRPLIEYAFAQDKNILAIQVKAVARQLARIKQANNLSNSDKNDANKQKRWHKWQKKQTEATVSTKPTKQQYNLYKVTPADLTIDHLLHYLADAPEGVDKEGDMILDVD